MPHAAPFKLHPLMALMTATAAGSLLANPQLPQVVHGQAAFQQAAKALTVTNSPGTIINWQQFNIDRGELTRFVQQNAASQVLNRVVGGDPSAILGKLQSNGRVFLVNPNGIVFGAGAQVDVAGLVASTLRLSNDDFLKNRLNFTDTPGAGGIQNQGNITTAAGGEVLLVAPKIENSGLIHAPDGMILLAAGRSVEVADIDRPNIRVEISNTVEEAVNLGTLMAQHISIYGGLVKNSGRIQASSAVMGVNGKIILKAAQRVEISSTSELTATGSQGGTGGEISITAVNTQGVAGAGDVLVQGLVSVNPTGLVEEAVHKTNLPLAVMDSALSTTNKLAAAVVAQAPAEPVQTAAAAPVAAHTEVVQDDPSGSNALANLALGAAAGLVRSAALAQRTSAPNPAGPATPTTPVPARPAPSTPALPVNPAAPASPAGGTGVGGSIRIGAGGRVLVGDGARLDASGELGGGEILVGGGWQGLNPNLINSQFTYIANTAALYANAQLRGNGGLVVVWADNTARIYGQVAAKGGALGGDGGAIETSGKRTLEVTRVADASATAGKGGQWLLDPNNVTIQTAGPNAGVSVVGSVETTLSTTADSAIVAVATIQAALNNGINVTINTSAGGAQLGDIVLNNAITVTSANPVTLTLNAHHNIAINAAITSSGNALNLVLNHGATGNAAVNSGVTVNLKGGLLDVQKTSVMATGTLTTLGTVVSATLKAASIGSGGLDGVTIGSNLAQSGGIVVLNDLTLANGVTLNKGSNNLLFVSGLSTTQHIAVQNGSGKAIINSTGGGFYAGILVSGQTVHIDSGITLQGYGDIGSSSPATVINAGTIKASISGQTFSITPSAFINSGTLNVASGATLNRPAGLTNTGTLSGSGTVVFGTGAAKLINQGNINPGSAGTVGTLSITGDVEFATGSNLNIDLGGINAGQSDKLAVSGNITHTAGTLTASLLLGYTPTTGTAIPFLIMGGTATGTFVNTALPSGFAAGYNLATGEAARLIYGSAGGSKVFNNAAGGLDWSNPGNWTGGTLPGSTDAVVLSAGSSVTHSTGTNTIGSLTINSANALNVSGGSLTVSGATSLNGNLTLSGAGAVAMKGPLSATATSGLSVSGGTLALSGANTLAGSLSLSAGTLTLNSDSTLTANGGANWTGGTLGGVGTLLIPTGKVTSVSGTNGLLNAALRVATGATLNLGTGTVLAGTGSLFNEGTLTANSLTWGANLTNGTGGVANLGGTLNGNFSNSGTLNVTGTLRLAGAVADLISGDLNLTTGSQLQRTNSALNWSGGRVAGQGSWNFNSGGDLVFAGTGHRELNAPNVTLTFANTNLPVGGLTLKGGTVTLTGSNTLGSGNSLTLDGGSLTNNGPLSVAGTMRMLSGTFAGSGTVTTTSTGIFDAVGGPGLTWSSTGALDNTGTMKLSGRTFTTPIANSGTMEMGSGLVFTQAVTSSGSLVALSGSNTQFQGGLTLSSGGLQLNHGDITGNVTLNGGILRGFGTVFGNVTVGSATLAPGFSPGALTIYGNLDLSAGSVLNLELGGTTQGTSYDYINVTGNAVLSGTLNISSNASFEPATDSTFTVMNFATRTGSFATITQPAGWSLAFVPGTTSFAVQTAAATPTPTPTPVPFTESSPAALNFVMAEVSQAQPLGLVLDRAVETLMAMDTTPAPEQKLVSVKKAIDEEACQ